MVLRYTTSIVIFTTCTHVKIVKIIIYIKQYGYSITMIITLKLPIHLTMLFLIQCQFHIQYAHNFTLINSSQTQIHTININKFRYTILQKKILVNASKYNLFITMNFDKKKKELYNTH